MRIQSSNVSSRGFFLSHTLVTSQPHCVTHLCNHNGKSGNLQPRPLSLRNSAFVRHFKGKILFQKLILFENEVMEEYHKTVKSYRPL